MAAASTQPQQQQQQQQGCPATAATSTAAISKSAAVSPAASAGPSANNDDDATTLRAQAANEHDPDADAVHPLPMFRVMVLACALFCNTFMGTMLLPFLTFMVDDFHIAPKPENIGTYSGYLVSSFMIGQAIFSYPWGHWSDVWGRRPVLIAGLLLTGSSFLCFGFSISYWMALACRFVNGAVNGIVGVTMTYMSEITNEKNQGRGFAILGVSRAAGIIFGPIVGGFLCMPAKKYPWLFPEGGLFDRFPYVLPCMVGFSVAMTGGLVAILVLEETKPRISAATPSELESCSGNHSDDQGICIEDESDDGHGDEDDDRTPLLLSASAQPQLPATAATACPDQQAKPEPLLTLLKSPAVSISVLLYMILNSIYIQYDETFVLWSRMPPSRGGLGFISSDQGIAFTVAGICLFVYQLFVYAAVERRFGTLRTFQLGLLLSLPGFMMMPLAANVYNEQAPAFMWAIVGVAQMLRTVGGLQAFTCTFVMMSNSVATKSRGSLNGFGQMMGAVGRMIGPIIAGNMFSWSLQNHLGPPLDHRFNFVMLVAQQIGALCLSLWVPGSINSRHKDD
ncbi:major facilitator superfamily domain-containing protein [Entophlyctis helioformis]|nr:major facilitator superfamily domain-containing protein [Entophlyctis helioformis]